MKIYYIIPLICFAIAQNSTVNDPSVDLGFKPITYTSEYSIGLNDKLGYFGFLSYSSTKKINEKRESYYVAGTTFILVGSAGYGQKYYFHRGKRVSTYCSLTGSAYYVLAIGALASANITGSLGLELTLFEGKKSRLISHFGFISMLDPVRRQSLVVAGEGGPSFLMPSLNIKFNRL